MNHKKGIYEKYIKRLFDFILSLIAIIIFSPVLFLLALVGVIQMKGNPFFVQKRIGLNGKEFYLIKYRSMTCERDKSGKLLSDDKRLTSYGKVLRKTSLDELGELFNILLGDMSIVGPRPLLPEYIDYYTEEEFHRHDVRPGLTGLAQVNGRSFIPWEEIFEYDLEYVKNISFINDIKIIFATIGKVLGRKDIPDLTESTIDKNGRLHFKVNGKDYILHQPLHIERGYSNAERNRK